MKASAALLLLLAPGVALAEPVEALKPMAFLAGHCWKGEFPGAKDTDEHCFSWLYDGKALRDVHTVRAPGRPDYVGETTYYWNPAGRRVEFLYVENQGGISTGRMEAQDSTLVFPPTEYASDAQRMTYRVRWTRMGDDAYEAWSEAQGANGWTTMFRVTLRRVS